MLGKNLKSCSNVFITKIGKKEENMGKKKLCRKFTQLRLKKKKVIAAG